MQYEVVGVQFKQVGKKYFFDPNGFELKKGDYVLVETIRGMEFGTVVIDPKFVNEEDVFLPLKPVMRIATDEDIEKHRKNKADEVEALASCEQLIIKNKLDMQLLGCEYTFDRTKLIFYFTAEGRVDFRQLVKDLAYTFRLRIELRQIGVRDAAKMIGGLGPCGRVLCCTSFLGEFATVTIKMAKNQQLSLNPSKISGICGKLLCCLKYENETYVELMQRLPDVGNRVLTEFGEGRVRSINMISETLLVDYKDTTRKHEASEIIKILDRKVKKEEIPFDPELKELMD
ncbi:stage 0 sporulation protein [Turicibacter sanguinis]|uniref:PSP1 domain-containing protein n=1 Tax=Turicibacter sanguinis TaxID=154288 RepID=UPI0011C7E10D|nr:stage 0 sporulation family protein [Turicibacter sanguinis]MDB8436510.1 stage 0 sporulation family protein [Turicibacter sanguinis]MDB8458375.1 stage 0 sporulation family protein [Turicibacter sanguinis]MDB8540366.1 stage 0 sporulation family protein [Turicibacter sanguinis]MDB8563898.1 stage 0 sporulation family protein [Turicibacter sanguinis]MTK81893.1 stage 0 sporulation protein [Turicibacter sanguinis]